MKMTAHIFLLVVATALAACGGKKSSSGKNGKGPGSEIDKAAGESTPIGTVSWLFQGFPHPFKAEHGFDAVTYTHGKMLIKSIPVVDGFALSPEESALSADVVTNKFVLLQSLAGVADPWAAMTPDDKDLLSARCRNMQVNLAGGAASGTLGTSEFEINWQSHFPPENTAKVGQLLLAAKVKFQCGLAFGLLYPGAAATTLMHLAFDPAPDFDPVKIHPADLYAGTDRFVVAKNETLMLPLVRDHKLDPFGADWQQVPLDVTPDVKAGVYALNSDDFVPDDEPDVTGDDCDLRLTDTLKVTNPDDGQAVSVAFGKHPTRSYKVKSAGYAPLPGKTTPEVCKALSYKLTGEDGFQFSMTCAQLRDIVQGGDCGVKVVFSNPDEPENTVERVLTLTGMKYELLDLKKPVNSVQVLPQAADNPIRVPPAGLTLTQFSATQLTELARAFDLWQLASPVSYVTYFKDQISEIIYDTSPTNCGSAGAYAYLSQDKIYWCPGGGLAGDALTAGKSPYYLVYRAATALHETLHTRGNPHDIDDAMNPPCSPDGGTAYSAVVAVDVYGCTEDACFGFRELAKEEFILELNYSLQDDARRFQGQCDIWAKKLGVTF